MGEGNGREKQSPFLQVLQHQGIGLFHKHAGPLGFLGQAALGVHQVHKGQAVDLAHPVVVLAKGGGDMHDARAVLHGDVIVAHHVPGGLVRLHKAVQGLVGHAPQALPGHFLQDGYFLARKDLLHQGLGHDEVLTLAAQAAVGILGVHAQGQVGGQGPGGGGPGQEGGILHILDLEAHDGGDFLNVLVALGHLVAGQGGAAAGAIGGDLVPQVEHALVVDLLQAPPFALDIVVMVGDVGVLHVHPVAYLVAHLLPLVEVFPHALFAFADEGLDAVLLNLRLAIQAQNLFHFQLHGQAVGVPASLAGDVLALHGPEAGEQVFDDAGFDVADMGLAVGRGRAVEEGEVLPVLAKVEGLVDHVLFLPQAGDLPLTGYEVQVGGDLVVHGADLLCPACSCLRSGTLFP